MPPYRKIKRKSYFGDKKVYYETVPLINKDETLWRLGDILPPEGSHMLDFPFAFQLPSDLPASYHINVFDTKATISYSIEVVGERSGTFVCNRRIGGGFIVVPPASPDELAMTDRLAEGWKGPNRIEEAKRHVRRRLWGDYAVVEATSACLTSRHTPSMFQCHLSCASSRRRRFLNARNTLTRRTMVASRCFLPRHQARSR